ncbi:hypothetical protein [Lysinibacillus sp. SGAir0095]|uniref:hypothetical protein n=1 Tax=Lysinibacillus sp. SGAir0095 TaxID=2070463 RepID=UPI0010CD57F1|nr:hypothetical protein [Lysinibacillus sp. SGAir0095]QCR33418.1 hypothetical protein C1N55_15240 [Lysinibacillus sp. SGAir0095]
MLQISRKLFALPFNQVFFQESKYGSRYEPKIICYTHVLKPSRKLQAKKTVHINLRNGESTLYNRMSDHVINLLDEIQEENWTITRFDHPSDQDIEEFQQLYNSNAIQKEARKLNRFDLQTLKLLRDQGGLVITKIENEHKDTEYYRVYVTGKEMVMALYDNGQALQSDKLSKSANYFLCWDNMKYFGMQGYRIYDFGDIKDSTLLEELKENFGGKMVTVFSGYVSTSPISQLLLQFNLRGLKKRLSY